MATAPKIGSPEWWRDRLLSDLRERTTDTQIYDDYYEGQHRLAFATSRFRRAFGELFGAFADNWCDLVVDAVEERLTVSGFRFTDPEADPTTTEADPMPADRDAWEMWQRNGLDVMSQQSHTEALVRGEAAVIVWQEDGAPLITVEHPEQVMIAHDPARLNRRLAAVKQWTDDWDSQHATLYTPDAIYKWTRPATETVMGGREPWQKRIVNGEPWPLRNPLGVVPVVPLVNRPRLLKPGRSEIAKVIPVQDAVNKLLMDMIVAAEFQAFRQRWATGLDLPDLVDDDGNKVPLEKVFDHAIDRLWYTDDPDTKFGEFSSTDLAPYVNGVEMLVQHIASQTRTPPHYFYLSGNFPSGESIKSAETGLVAKVNRRAQVFGETWEEVIRLGFRITGDPRGADMSAETIWKDPESRTESEHVDAVTKKGSVGVPQEQLWEDLGYSPKQISRFQEMQRREALRTSTLASQFGVLLDAPGVNPNDSEV